MSDTLFPTPGHTSPEGTDPSPSSQRPKPSRVLACVACQQRKIKCDRKFPCAHCLKQNVQCVPATQSRRRQRFPERDLLRRLAHYEDLLRQHSIRFNPLHQTPNPAAKANDAGADSDSSYDEQSSRTAASPAAADPFDLKSIWGAILHEGPTHTFPFNHDGHDQFQHSIKEALDVSTVNDSHLFPFGSAQTIVDLSTFHPQPIDVFRLWQIYLDNVNPLTKVIHAPTMQGRLIEAVTDVHSISPSLEALMFGIYCIAIMSLEAEDCQSMFGLSQSDLMTKYLFGCQQALMNAKFLFSKERDTLVALYLYLLSLPFNIHPRSLSALFSIAIRTAKGNKLNREPPPDKAYSVFEAELERRLWWALVMDDTRRCEVANVCTDAPLSPVWARKTPANVNDSDLRPDMTQIPTAGSAVSDAIFAVVRGELADFLRHKHSFLDFHHPSLKPIAKELPDGGSWTALHKRIENDYLRFCDPENPLHYMTIWSTAAFIAKQRMMDHYSRLAGSDLPPTEAQMDDAMLLAFDMLDSDTKLITAPKIKGFLWFLRWHFPFPAYMHIMYDLKRRPLSKHAERAWELIGISYRLRMTTMKSIARKGLIKAFGRIILRSWEARVAVATPDTPLTPPSIVLEEWKREAADNDQPAGGMGWDKLGNVADVNLNNNNSFDAMPTDVGVSDLFDVDAMGNFSGPGAYSSFPSQGGFDFVINNFNWPPAV